jgi:Domain of unknown function (DUF4112)
MSLDLILWLLAVAVAFSVGAFFGLRWLALGIARRVAEAAERGLAASLRTGVRRMRLPPADDAARRARYLAQIERLAWLMDRAIPLPLVGGIGLDALIGLVPGIGDAVSFAVSAVIVVRAAQLGASPDLLTRLTAIQCADFLLGALPLVGDLFDVVYKADVRCAALIREALDSARDDAALDVGPLRTSAPPAR